MTTGEALLAPSVTRRIIEQFARRPVRPELGTRLDALTQREREVLRMLAHGKSNAELAAELFVTRVQELLGWGVLEQKAAGAQPSRPFCTATVSRRRSR